MKSRIILGALSAMSMMTLSLSSYAQSYSRTEKFVYSDNTEKWVLGQVKSVTCVAPSACTAASPSGIVMSQTDYDPATALPMRTYAFGVLQNSYAWELTPGTQAGTLRKIIDGKNESVTYTNWKRGIPQTVSFPATEDQAALSTTAVVEDNGWIKSVTDENGYTTSYDYDLAGRLRLIRYPTNDSQVWNDVTMTFAPTAAAEYDLPAGHWLATRNEGNKRTRVHYDAMWRPIFEETFDQNDKAGTNSQVIKRYDDEGHLAFQSYPTRGVSSYNANVKGVFTLYDALDRVTSVSQDSELGLLTTMTDYLDGFKMRVTDPNLNVTTTRFMAFDQPTYDMPVGIEAPMDQYTDIARDVFGKPRSIVRRNGAGTRTLSRSFVYGADQRLCKTIEPEAGSTITHYDLAGNVDWTAAGLNLASTTSCQDSDASVAARKVLRSYDARHRLKTLTFPDGNSSQQWTYWPDNLPKQITTQSIAPDTGDVKVTTNDYTYNMRRLLKTETTAIPGSFSYPLGYSYDANGNLSAQNYPDNLIVLYAPNALGQPTAVSAYGGQAFATAVKYHPTGAIQQFTYGNGILHTMQPNARQLPNRSIDGGILDFTMEYDKNANVSTIYDAAQGNNFYRSMDYDGLNRLTHAASPSFEGDDHHRYTYDVFDNLESWKNGSARNYYYNHVAATNRLVTISNGQGGPAIQGFEFDAQGNLYKKSGTVFTFDYANRLREAFAVNTLQERYRYDGLGRRVWSNRLVGPASTVGLVFSQYANNGQLLFQKDAPKGKNIDYIYLGNSLLARRDQPFNQPAVVTYQHTDPLGTPVATSNAGGALVERTQYEPYGKVYGSTPKDGPGYTGHVLDTSTGMNYMQQRYYDPGIGRFLSVDPVTADSVNGSNFNRYWYANNNLYKFTDPDGRDAIYFTDTRTLVFPVYFTGSGATPANIEKVRAEINSMKSEDSRVQRVVLAVLDKPGGAGTNVMDLSPGKDNNYGSRGEGAEVGGQHGHIDSTRSDAPQAARHDIMHNGGARDGYTMDGDKAVNDTGYNDTHTMGRDTGGDTLRPHDVDNILENETTYKFQQKDL